MSKFIDSPLDTIRVGHGGRPAAFTWRGRRFVVDRTAEVWKDAGCWWEGEGEKIFFRLECNGGKLLEVYLDRAAGEWFLYRVYD